MADVELEEITTESLHLSRIFLNAIGKQMGADGQHLGEMKMVQLQQISGLLTKVQRALTGLVKEQRALVKDAVAAAKGLSYEAKTDMIVQFFAMMPPEHRKNLRERMDAVDAGGVA